eukprot:tig00020943_g16307.t1
MARRAPAQQAAVLQAGKVARPYGAGGAAQMSPVVIAIAVVVLSYVAQKLLRRKKPTAAAAKKDAPKAAAATKPVVEEQKEEHGFPLLILFGTQTGNAENFARQLAQEARKYFFAPKVLGMNEVMPFEDIPKRASLCIVLTSTFGEGEPPDNAVDFWKWVAGADRAPDTFKGLKFTVFGLGNKQYEHYQAMGRGMEKHFERLGGEIAFERGEGDDDGTLEEDFNKWKARLWPGIAHFAEAEGAKMNGAANGHVEAAHATPAYKLVLHDAATHVPDASEEAAALAVQQQHSVSLARVAVNRELHTPASDRSCRHIEIEIPNLSYEAGDHLGVHPENEPAVVEAAARRLGLSLDTVFSLVPADEAASQHGPFASPMTLRAALTRLVDLTGPPRKSYFRALAEYAEHPDEKERLLEIASNSAEYNAFVVSALRTPVEVLCAFSSVIIPLEAFLPACGRLQPRYYSISSSHKATPGRVHITVSVVRYATPTGRAHNGVCSTWLAALKPGAKVPLFVRRSAFKLPPSIATPIVMVGPGTGLAPFRGFLWELHALQAAGAAAEAHLYFGCRSSKVDYIYQEELERFVAAGLLKNLRVAFSREGAGKVYVQHKLAEDGRLLWPLLRDRGAYFYVCGDARAMAKDVSKAVHAVAEGAGGLSPDEAAAFVKHMHASGRYQQDVWY